MKNIQNSSNTTQVFWAGLAGLSSFIIGIISAMILSRLLSKTEYGSYRQILYVYNTLLVVFTSGLPRVYSYYLPKYDINQGKDIVSKISRTLFFLGLIFSITLFIFSHQIAIALNNPLLENGLKMFSPIPILLLPTLGIEGIFSSYRKNIYIAVYNLSTRLITLVCIVVPVIIFKRNFIYAIYGWILGSLITSGVAFYFKGIPFKKIVFVKSQLKIKEILKYCWPLVIASISGIAIKAADQFYISRYFGSERFAEFSNGFIELPFVHMITAATTTVLMPLFSKLLHDKKNIIQITETWQNALIKSAILIYPFVIYSLFFSNEIITVLYTKKYSGSNIYFIIALSINFFNIIVFTPLILAYGKTKSYALLHYIFAIISWIGGYFIVIIFQNPIAIAVFSSSRTILIVIIALVFASNISGIKFIDLFPVKRLITISMHSVLCILVIKLLFGLIQIENYLITLLISLILFVFCLYFTSPLIKLDYKKILKPLFNR